MTPIIPNARTKLYAILGDPISHSLSPVIMNHSFTRGGLDSVFIALRCDAPGIQRAMETLLFAGFCGFTFTMPLKESVGAYMDALSLEARISGAVNCAGYRRDKTLVGYNTDSIGFWAALLEKWDKPAKIRKLFVLGAGGFSKAAVTQAALQGVREIVVTHRAEDTAYIEGFRTFQKRLYREIPGTRVALVPWAPQEWGKHLAGADVVVNATSNGLGGKGDLHLQFPYERVRPGAAFFDAIYTPPETAFLKAARLRGHMTVGGLDLLVHQGVQAYHIWTGLSLDPQQMREDALRFLQTKI